MLQTKNPNLGRYVHTKQLSFLQFDLFLAEDELDDELTAYDLEFYYQNVERPVDEPTLKRDKKTPNTPSNWTKEDLQKTNSHIIFVPTNNEKILYPLEYFKKFFSFDIMTNITDKLTSMAPK